MNLIKRPVSSWMPLGKLLKIHRLSLYLKPYHGETHQSLCPLLQVPPLPPDDNPTGDIFHAEVIEVDFIGVDNFLASSQVAPVFDDSYRDKRLIMELVRKNI